VPKSLTVVQTLAGSALMVTLFSTFCGDGPWALAKLGSKLMLKLKVKRAKIFFIFYFSVTLKQRVIDWYYASL
jgi:hypothetical protein